ncbi:hypothetical protein Hamer_G014247 [Homarus americanus]|uniref:Uncharacterized protein n=1 Tax=Homarus americanus TaxID=6706 RepID=A0A8J5MUI3_HOMAM|nr:hypothetical protein Hamer_G014247 [Homarus americanus]
MLVVTLYPSLTISLTEQKVVLVWLVVVVGVASGVPLDSNNACNRLCMATVGTLICCSRTSNSKTTTASPPLRCPVFRCTPLLPPTLLIYSVTSEENISSYCCYVDCDGEKKCISKVPLHSK